MSARRLFLIVSKHESGRIGVKLTTDPTAGWTSLDPDDGDNAGGYNELACWEVTSHELIAKVLEVIDYPGWDAAKAAEHARRLLRRT